MKKINLEQATHPLAKFRHFIKNFFFLKNFVKITGGQKIHFFKINKGSRFSLLRFGLVSKSRKRFGRFEVWFTRGSGGSRFGIFRFDPTLVWALIYEPG